MEILKYKKFTKGCLLGYFDVMVPKWGNFIIRSCRLFQKNGRRWISFPDEKVEQNGETKYYPYNRFQDKETHNIFSNLVLQAIDDYCLKNPQEEQKKESDDDNWLGF